MQVIRAHVSIPANPIKVIRAHVSKLANPMQVIRAQCKLLELMLVS